MIDAWTSGDLSCQPEGRGLADLASPEWLRKGKFDDMLMKMISEIALNDERKAIN